MKLKAWYIYTGQNDWLNAAMIFENGWAPFGHCCSAPGYMPGDLWERRKERQEILKKMSIEVDADPEPVREEEFFKVHPEVLDLHKNSTVPNTLNALYTQYQTELEHAQKS